MAAVSSLVSDAQSRNLVRASGMRLTITVNIIDSRRDQRTPLPAIPARDLTIP